MAFDPSLVAFTAGIGGMPQERPEGGCAKGRLAGSWKTSQVIYTCGAGTASN